jgi:Ca-activated chloride channel family protein
MRTTASGLTIAVLLGLMLFAPAEPTSGGPGGTPRTGPGPVSGPAGTPEFTGWKGCQLVHPVAPPEGSESFVPEADAPFGTGTLRVRSASDVEIREFPLKHTKVDAVVTGPVARVRVTQTFQNPYEETIEAVYVFPLPHEAAVTDLEMRIGERMIRGLIERRAEAQRIYEDAKRRGRVAALLEEERANVFTQSVANILPGNEIDITLTYVESLDYESGTYEFAFPMVVGPRYIPPGEKPFRGVPAGFTPPADDHGLRPPRGGSSVPDAHRINPPFLPPSIRSGHDIEVEVEVEAGLPVKDLRSPTHVFERLAVERGRTRVRLHPLDTIPNKDFVLRWTIDGDEPETGVLTHSDGEEGYVAVLLHPKTDLEAHEITPKEMVFVLDCSGSMMGEPLGAAKALVRHALHDLGSDDSFQIIRFSTRASGLSPEPLAATGDNVKRALAYLDGLRGGGGTQMIEGIKAALDYRDDPHRLRIVMFLTDGYIGNDHQILAAVRDRIRSARLFSFGVGSSVNRFLLDEMAREGRGEVHYFLPGSDVRESVEKFYDRVRSPYLTDIALEWRGVEVADVFPERVPDLFQGKPLVVRARYGRGGSGELVVRGKIAGRGWEKRIPVELPRSASGSPAIGSLWARSRIADLERTMRGGEIPATVEEITRLGLRHRLVTRYTSFVAVEETLVVSDGVPKTVRVPVEMPEGVSWEGVFGDHGGAAAPIRYPGRATSVGAVSKGILPHAAREGRLLSDTPVVRAPRDARSEEVEADRYRSPDDGPPTSAAQIRPGVEIRVETSVFEVPLDGELTLTVTFMNRGRAPVEVPAEGAWTLESLGLKVIDARWRETRIGDPPRTLPTVTLAPGESATREITVPAARLGRPAAPGLVHLFLPGERWGAKDSPRVTVRIVEG